MIIIIIIEIITIVPIKRLSVSRHYAEHFGTLSYFTEQIISKECTLSILLSWSIKRPGEVN